jgi:hypothetical protein
MELPNKHAACPNCGEKLDAATSVTDKNAIPKEGDIGICFKCGTLLEYEEGFFVHELSQKSLDAIKLIDENLYITLVNTQTTVKLFRRLQPKPTEETGIVYFDENCHDCIYRINTNQCELDTDDESPCFRYDHFTPGIKLN